MSFLNDLLTVGSITRSKVYGCSSELRGEVGVTGW